MIERTDAIDLEGAAKKLGLELPTTTVVLLPRNFSAESDRGDLVYEDETDTLLKVLRREGIATSKADAAEPFVPGIQERYDLFVLPALLLTEPNAISLVVNVLSSYIYDALKGRRSGAQVCVDLTVQDADGTVSFKYVGNGDGLDKMADLVREAKAKHVR